MESNKPNSLIISVTEKSQRLVEVWRVITDINSLVIISAKSQRSVEVWRAIQAFSKLMQLEIISQC
jgi:dihydropteroate synthase